MEQNKLNELCRFQDLAGYYVKKIKVYSMHFHFAAYS